MKKVKCFPALFYMVIVLIFPENCIGQSNTKAEITMLSYNAWIGGTQVNDGQSKTLNVILRSGADIAGISEATDGIADFLVDRLGWYSYITDDNIIISRYPIKKTWSSVKGAGAEVEIENGKKIVIKTVHLHYTPYGPYRACLDNASISEIINEETTSGRMDEIKAALGTIDVYLNNGTPVFLMGDFNVPSHLDWTKSMAEKHCGYYLEWPVTKVVENFGIRDSYREAHPDPSAFPGITWSPIYKKFLYENGKYEPLDRIDFIFYSGDEVTTLSSETFIIGTPDQISHHEYNEWPSDHAAVISRFNIEIDAVIDALPESKFFASTPVIFENGKISFTDLSTKNPTSWLWMFEGGTPESSSEQHPVITYNTAGNYDVTLITSNPLGIDTTKVTDFIVVKPEPK